MEVRTWHGYLFVISDCLNSAATRAAGQAVLDLAWARQNLEDAILRHASHRSTSESLAADEWHRVFGQADLPIKEIHAEAAAAEAAVRESLGETVDEKAVLEAVRSARDEVYNQRSEKYAATEAVVAVAHKEASEARARVLADLAEPELAEELALANGLERYARERLEKLTAPGSSLLQAMRM